MGVESDKDSQRSRIDNVADLDIDSHHSHSVQLANEIGTDFNFKREIVWFNAIGFLILHLAGIYGLYLMLTRTAMTKTGLYGRLSVPSGRDRLICIINLD